MTGKIKWNVLWLTCTFFIALLPNGNTQIFPGLVGEDLVEALRADYSPILLLDDAQVKDTLYARIFIKDDSVRCIYSGLSRLLPSAVDPSQWLFGNGLDVGSINLEHSWPQSLGAGEGTNGNRDMHHLYPSRTSINSTRGNFPFGEINDNTTQKWYYEAVETAVKPSANIDAYSEYKNGAFEPRESVKGDIARAMFYFWTIYRADAVAADPIFFELQLSDLCQWHALDPVDADEALRNERIAQYQDGKLNPFILDCSLVRRAYCSELATCETVATNGLHTLYANISYDAGTGQFKIEGDHNFAWKLFVSDLSGRVCFSQQIQTNVFSGQVYLAPGLYITYAVSGRHIVTRKIFIP